MSEPREPVPDDQAATRPLDPPADATPAHPDDASASWSTGPIPTGYVPVAPAGAVPPGYVAVSPVGGGPAGPTAPPRASRMPSWWRYAAVGLASLLVGCLIGGGVVAIVAHHWGDDRGHFRKIPGYGPGMGPGFGNRPGGGFRGGNGFGGGNGFPGGQPGGGVAPGGPAVTPSPTQTG